MFLFFANPWAFLGFLSLPALTTIYLLRSRHRRQMVSSLMLWMDTRESLEGGPRIARLQTPLLFFLELLILTLLVLAAAQPHMRASQRVRPLVVVLDDSFSMSAGDEDSPRNQALKALEEELADNPRPSVRFVLAGNRPGLLGDRTRSWNEMKLLLNDWHCRSTSAELLEATALASALEGEHGLVLVLTDQAPDPVPGKGRLRWWAFGRTRDNLAIVHATRNYQGKDRYAVEVANLSSIAQSTTLELQIKGAEAKRSAIPLQLASGETYTHRDTLTDPASTVHASLNANDLAIDNQIDLLPVRSRAIHVRLDLRKEEFREPVQKAVQAVQGTTMASDSPDIVFTDHTELPDLEPGTWVVQLVTDPEAKAYRGPFVLDRTHPLTKGLSLEGVIWGARAEARLPGTPIIMVGDIPLLTDQETVHGHTLRLRLDPAISTLHKTIDWPALIWNIIHYYRSEAPGLNPNNLRLGEETILRLLSIPESLQLLDPDGDTHTLPIQGRRVVVRGEKVGISNLKTEAKEYPFATNALARGESDLTKCLSGRWGDWLDETTLRLEYENIAWMLLLAALGVVLVHQLLVVLRRRGRGPSESRA